GTGRLSPRGALLPAELRALQARPPVASTVAAEDPRIRTEHAAGPPTTGDDRPRNRPLPVAVPSGNRSPLAARRRRDAADRLHGTRSRRHALAATRGLAPGARGRGARRGPLAPRSRGAGGARAPSHADRPDSAPGVRERGRGCRRRRARADAPFLRLAPRVQGRRSPRQGASPRRARV